jgi:hypothetical protein
MIINEIIFLLPHTALYHGGQNTGATAPALLTNKMSLLAM